MCSIVGYSGNLFSLKDIKSGLLATKYRGPDESIVAHLNATTIFAMNRLAIRDLKKKLYPFKYKQYVLIFNGEIYNSEELKQLITPKHQWQTNCDAEVILPLFDMYGPKVLAKFIGMFALAIYDSREDCMYLSRDQFGEKPLYYYINEGNVFFGSEISSFPKKCKVLDHSAITEYLSLGFRSGDKTFYQHIKKVEPGQCLKYNCGKRTLSKSTRINTKKIDLPTSLKSLDQDLNEIIAQKIVSDVPVGVFLSGGLDSGLIASLISKKSSNPLYTYSIRFDDSKLDESNFSSLLARKLKTHHTEINCTPQKVLANWDTVVNRLDEPICDPALFPTFLLAEAAKKQCTVILTGEGADEIFAGYPRYFHEKLANLFFGFMRRRTASLRSVQLLGFLVWKLITPLEKHYSPIPYKSLWLEGSSSQKKYIGIIQSVWKKNPFKDQNTSLIAPQLFDLKNYVSEQLCMKIDKITMFHSIEARAPFLDRRLLKYMLPSSKSYLTPIRNKYLLKKVAQNYLPSEIVFQRKKSFALPLAQWFAHELLGKVNELRSPHPALAQQLSQKTLEKLIQAAQQGNSQLALTIWNVVTLNSWLKANFP